MKDVVTENESDLFITDELLADNERLCESIWRRLHGIRELDSQFAAVTKQSLKLRLIIRSRDDENLADARTHESRQGVVHHGLVIDGHELLGNALSNGPQARTAATGQNNSAH